MPFLGQRTISMVLAACATAVALGGLLLPGCSTAPPGTPVYDEEEAALPKVARSMRVASSFGGSHRALQIVGNTWFQTFANRVLLLESQTGTVMSDVELSPRGTTGPAVDLLHRDNHLWVVLEGDAVIELDVEQPRAPKFLARWGRPELGLAPQRLSLVDGEILVSGDGGVIRLAEAPAEGTSFNEKGKPVPPVPPARALDGKIVGTVVAAEGGPVACVGRRIVRVATGEYLGAASMLVPVPPEYGGGYAFALQASEGAEVGLLGTNFRERSSSALRGTIRSIRVFDDRFLAVNEFEIATWKLETKPGADTISQGDGIQLGTPIAVSVKGAVDVGKVKTNRYAVSGSFGRSLYRYLPEGDKPGDNFYWSERAPGRLDVCVSDRRRVLAAGVEGSWMYLIGEKAELIDRDIPSPDAQSPSAEVAWGSASCDEKREEVVFRIGDRAISHLPSRAGLVSTIAAADGKVWIGHDHGIDVIGFDPVTGELVEEDRIVLAGPVIAIYPNRVGGGVTYVARFDGFGVIRAIPVTDPPIATPGTVCGYDAAAPAKQQGANR